MKLDYLPDGSPDCPLVRLWDFSVTEAAELYEAFSWLACGRRTQIVLHELPGVAPVDGCMLRLISGSRDSGLVSVGRRGEFEGVLTPDGWDTVSSLTEPFVQGDRGYQWLIASGDAKLLLSSDGLW